MVYLTKRRCEHIFMNINIKIQTILCNYKKLKAGYCWVQLLPGWVWPAADCANQAVTTMGDESILMKTHFSESSALNILLLLIAVPAGTTPVFNL